MKLSNPCCLKEPYKMKKEDLEKKVENCINRSCELINKDGSCIYERMFNIRKKVNK